MFRNENKKQYDGISTVDYGDFIDKLWNSDVFLSQ